MKRYYFDVWNIDGVLIDSRSVVANSMESAREKVSFQLSIKFGSCFVFLKSVFNKTGDIL